MDAGILTSQQLETIRETLTIRNVEITEIRPRQELSIGPFAGFFKKQNREQLIELGRKAALEILSQLPDQNPTGTQTT